MACQCADLPPCRCDGSVEPCRDCNPDDTRCLDDTTLLVCDQDTGWDLDTGPEPYCLAPVDCADLGIGGRCEQERGCLDCPAACVHCEAPLDFCADDTDCVDEPHLEDCPEKRRRCVQAEWTCHGHSFDYLSCVCVGGRG
jgi:hypothetical protein